MTKTLLTLSAVALLTSPSLFAEQTKSQVRVQESVEYKEDVQHQYRYQTEEEKEHKYKYKGDSNQPKHQYQHRNNMNTTNNATRSMGSSKGGGKR